MENQNRNQNEGSVAIYGESFCGNCGSPVLNKSDVCTSCGANPKAHRNFCRSCGIHLNTYQVACVKCGVRVATDASINLSVVNPPIIGSIVVLILAPIFGIFSLVFSLQASDAAKRGDYTEAVAKAKTAHTINTAFWCVAILFFILVIAFIFFVVAMSEV